MKSTKSGEIDQKEKLFPKLMVSKEGRVVLFRKPGVGAVVFPTERMKESDADWDMSCFKDYEGTITLSND